jgi:hypothetical protein
MNERKVKGTMLVDQARMIRRNRQLSWDEYLTPEDWAKLEETILPSTWYPLELFRRWGWATFNVLAKRDLALTRQRGRARGRELFEQSYQNLFHEKNPAQALRVFTQMYGSLFNFSTLEFESLGEKRAQLRHDYDPDDPSNEPYCHQLMGYLDALVELTGGQDVDVTLASKQWEGAPMTTFDITWK